MVKPTDQVGLGHIEFVITAVDENTLGVQKSTHGAIAQHWGSLQPR